MPIQVLQRDSWDRAPRKQDETFRLKKGRLTAECELWSNPLGWELKLVAGKEFLQTAVCRTHDEVFDTTEKWKTAMLEKGWC